MYLQISNQGLCPPDRFLIFGLTTSRGVKENIGQFGSGIKHAILTLMRSNIEIIIYSGNTEITFLSKQEFSDNHPYRRVYYYVNGVEHSTNIALEFGELDWSTSIEMALREIIANAIDCAQDITNIIIEEVEKPYGAENITSVFVKSNAQIREYINQLANKFLHFRDDGSLLNKIVEKNDNSGARIFHKGVFVKEINNHGPSLFDYNFGDEIKIDESRNLNIYGCMNDAAKSIATNKEALKKVFFALKENKTYYETSFYRYQLEDVARRNSELWKQAWLECFGDKSVMVGIEDGILARKAIENGYKPILFHNKEWINACIIGGIPTPIQVCTNIDHNGSEIIPPTKECILKLKEVWSILKECNMTFNKEIPNIWMFRRLTKNNQILCGYTKDNTIYINEEFVNYPTIFEELSHYISEYCDETRDFQNYLLMLICEMKKKIQNKDQLVLT